ncbi:MAG: DUF6398 domain-containing protein [Chloroflexota bacterium]|nr:DUF6398 domain-containing protein [Chloroflexota bacterium]
MPEEKAYRVPKKMRSKYDAIVELTDDFCQAHFDDDYADLCRKLTATLSRKRPSPLARGHTKSWAAAVLYTIGRVNFLFDESRPPYMQATELCRLIDVSQSTASSKSTDIMEMLDIIQLDPDWTLPSLMDDNPLAWYISVNGLILDARRLPREIQEEAFRKGLIPYIPQ